MGRNLSAAQARQQNNRTGDGRYAEGSHGEPDVDLTDSGQVESAHDRWQRRLNELADGGYTPAVATRASVPPATTVDRERWWDEHFATGEYHHDDGAHPKMPDDYTPGRTGGLAMSGHRRTHRMRYEGSGVTLRMPSASAIRRFQSEGNDTFDVPVTVETQDGRQVSGWVRMSGSDRSWDASALGFKGDDQVSVSEAVTAVMEARRPSVGLAMAGDLLARHRQRMAERGVESRPVASTWIRGLAYDDDSETMVMETDRKSYGFGVDRETYDAVATSHSPGAAFTKLVRNRGVGVEVNQCGQCSRYYSTDGHSCPREAGPRQESDPWAEQARSRVLALAGRPNRTA